MVAPSVARAPVLPRVAEVGQHRHNPQEERAHKGDAVQNAGQVLLGGCAGALGCFRVLNFRTDPDGKRAVAGGDGWVIAVEFGRDAPRAYSILAYGQSPREDSPYHSDQAAMFARGDMKRVLFLNRDIEAGVVARYRPGAP